MSRSKRQARRARQAAQQSVNASTKVVAPQQTTTPQQPANKASLWQLIIAIWSLLIAPFSKISKQGTLALRLQGEIANIEIAIPSGTVNMQHQRRWLELLKGYLECPRWQRQNLPSLSTLLETSVALLTALPKQVPAEQLEERKRITRCFQKLLKGRETYAEYLASLFRLLDEAKSEAVKERTCSEVNGDLWKYVKSLQKRGSKQTLAYEIVNNALSLQGHPFKGSSYIKLLEEQQKLFNGVLGSLQDDQAVEVLGSLRERCSERMQHVNPAIVTKLLEIEASYVTVCNSVIKRAMLPSSEQLDPQKSGLFTWLTYKKVGEDLRRVQALIDMSIKNAQGQEALLALSQYQLLLPPLIQASGNKEIQSLTNLLEACLEDAQSLSKGHKLVRLQTI